MNKATKEIGVVVGKDEIKICSHYHMLHQINILMHAPLFSSRETP